MDLKLLVLSLLRLIGIAAIFVGSWLLAYALGRLLAAIGALDCSDAAECDLYAAVVMMPLGGTALYFLALVIRSIVARHNAARA
ncbi:hypothetical protein [Arvimicrobium flavum]|uniref:hypothetical protein n=1 Tax=Arvimicrobium flavum TaxID=3393320 RepID=UPI00237C352B|nr:hypothetical protein [Mesorhizobium shangrilense]